MVMQYWMQGFLTSDKTVLSRIARIADLDPDLDVVLQYFTLQEDGLYHHKRIDKELIKTNKIQVDRSNAAKASWLNRRCKSDANANAKADANQIQSPCKVDISYNHKVHASKETSPTSENTEVDPPSKKSFSEDSKELILAGYLLEMIHKRTPNTKADLQEWAKHIDLLLRIDKADFKEVEEVIEWAHTWEGEGTFNWYSNIRSAIKLRQKYDKLLLDMKTHKSGSINKSPKRTSNIPGGVIRSTN
jgi:uncharacterized protein YdaU (DUF1376 family)